MSVDSRIRADLFSSVLRPAALLWIAWIGTACSRPAPAGQPTVTDSAGIEIATLRDLPSLTDPAWRWETEVEREIPTVKAGAEKPPLVFDPFDIVPLASDTLLVHDRTGDQQLVLLSVADTTVVARFGARGQGPEEMSGIAAMWVDPQGTIRTFDLRGLKILTFTRSGDFVRAQGIPRRAYRRVRAAPDGSRVFAHRIDSGSDGASVYVLSRLDPTGDEIGLEDLGRLPPAPGSNIQNGRVLWMAFQWGVVATRSDRPVYEVADPNGRAIRSIRLPLSRRRLGRSEIDAEIRRSGNIASGFREGPIALTNELNSFGDSIFALYQSELWRAAEDPRLGPDEVIWRLISVSGRYMGTFEQSVEFRPVWIDDGIAWGVGADSSGEPVIQRRRLIRPPALLN